MDQKCGIGDTTIVAGKRWLSIIAIGSEAPDRAIAIHWDANALKQKLTQVQKTTKAQATTGSVPDGRWTAIYGLLEAPRNLRPPSGSRATYRAGNGYGANGSVAARLNFIEGYDFPF
jgi:hypothetical protein